ncbi:MAG: Gfo/Idh/MocA family oxidoreductase [Kouleothrix sp.]
MNELGVGLIGYGGIGRMHALCLRMLPLVYPGLPMRVRLAAVATASAASAEQARHELGSDLFVSTSAAELIGHPDVALVDCCAPTGEHARLAEAVLMAGKPLFCEKPLTADADASARLVKLARAYGVAGGVNYHFRAIPALRTPTVAQAGCSARQAASTCATTGPAMCATARPPGASAAPGRACWPIQGAHLIDLVLHLLGPIASVRAHARTLVPTRPGPDGMPIAIDADDAAWLELQLAGGGRARSKCRKWCLVLRRRPAHRGVRAGRAVVRHRRPEQPDGGRGRARGSGRPADRHCQQEYARSRPDRPGDAGGGGAMAHGIAGRLSARARQW